MAKGDAMGGALGSAANMGMNGAPKQNQYSVMHAIFDHLGNRGGAIGPSMGTGMNRGMQQPMMGNMDNSLAGPARMNDNNGMGQQYIGQAGTGGGSMGITPSMAGNTNQPYAQQGAMSPNMDWSSIMNSLKGGRQLQ